MKQNILKHHQTSFLTTRKNFKKVKPKLKKKKIKAMERLTDGSLKSPVHPPVRRGSNSEVPPHPLKKKTKPPKRSQLAINLFDLSKNKSRKKEKQRN